MNWPELTLAGIAGIAGGSINALAGGGTLISFPILTAAGIPPMAADITNTVALCPGYLGGTFAQIGDLKENRRMLWLLCPTGAIGGVAGGILLLCTGEHLFHQLVPYLILMASGLLAIEGNIRKWLTGRTNYRSRHKGWMVLPLFLASLYGGYFGAGLSIIVLAVLALLVSDTLTRLNALKQLTAFSVNISAAIFFLFSGKVVWMAALVMAVGALAGGVIGGLLAGRLRPAVLRVIVVAAGILVSIIYFIG